MTCDVRQLDVPGARLHYEVRGAGPVLLIIPGGPTDAYGFAGLAEALASDYTVVTYDPRGISRSTRDDPAADIAIETQADDAYRLLAAIGSEPAYVLGSSFRLVHRAHAGDPAPRPGPHADRARTADHRTAARAR